MIWRSFTTCFIKNALWPPYSMLDRPHQILRSGGYIDCIVWYFHLSYKLQVFSWLVIYHGFQQILILSQMPSFPFMVNIIFEAHYVWMWDGQKLLAAGSDACFFYSSRGCPSKGNHVGWLQIVSSFSLYWIVELPQSCYFVLYLETKV